MNAYRDSTPIAVTHPMTMTVERAICYIAGAAVATFVGGLCIGSCAIQHSSTPPCGYGTQPMMVQEKPGEGMPKESGEFRLVCGCPR